MATGSSGGVALPQDVAASIDAATSAPASALATPTVPTTPQGFPGGVSAMPIDANTWIKVSIPGNPSLSPWASSISITLTARILLGDGTLSYCRWDQSFVPASGLSFVSDMAPGYLLSVALTCNTTGIVDGMLYGVVGLVHQPQAALPLDTILISSYFTTSVPVGWPGGILRTLSEGDGFMVYISLSNPAAGANATYTVVDQLLELTVVGMILTTSSTAANRYTHVSVAAPGLSSLAVAVSPYEQAASSADGYTFGVGMAQVTSGTVYNFTITMCPSVRVPQGGSVILGVYNIQSGDQLSSLAILGRAWL